MLALAASCAGMSGPEYRTPDTPEKNQWSNAPDDALVRAAIEPDWWRGFGDPQLNDLIDHAIAQNFDLRVLAARTAVARSSISQARATKLPTVEASVSQVYENSSQGPGSRGYTYGSNLAWEIDIWGKLEKGVRAREAAYQASEADWRAGYLSLVADVANTYFQLRLYDEQIAQQRDALARSRDILQIYRSQYGEGLVPETQVDQQEAEVSQLRVDLLELQRLRQLAANTLTTLLGGAGGEMAIPEANLRDTVRPIDVPGGLPSDLLTRRPDIIAAQYRVLEAYELEGEASLARLPSISLTSNVGNASQELSSLFSSWTLGLTPSLSIPLFNPGVQARYRVSQAESTLAEEQYRASVIRAYGEVENALTNLFNRKKQHGHLEQRHQKLTRVTRQVHARLAEGLVSQLEVFEAERSLLATSQQLLANHQLILADSVELYKAMGGGWPQQVVEQL